MEQMPKMGSVRLESKPWRGIVKKIICIGVVCLLAGCSKHSSAPGGRTGDTKPYTPPNSVFDVHYTTNTIRMDLSTFQRTFHSISSDGQVLVFDSGDPQIATLSEGKVLFVQHVGVRKIVAVKKIDSQVAIATESPALTDFIQDGDIEFSTPVFAADALGGSKSKPTSLAGIRGWLWSPDVVYAQAACGNGDGSRVGLQAKGSLDDWQYLLEGRPDSGNLLFCLQIIKKLSSLNASVTAKGELKNLYTKFKASVRGGQVQSLDYNAPMEGKVTVNWAALTSGPGAGIGEARFASPPLYKQVIDLYGFPLLLQVTAQVIFKPGFGGKHDAGSGGFEVTYNGSGGMSVHGQQPPQQEGEISSDMALNHTTTESLAPHGVVLAFAVPKLSISFGTDSFAEALKKALPKGLLDKTADKVRDAFEPFLKKKDFFKIEAGVYGQIVSEFDYTGSGPLSVVPCSITHISVQGQIGVDATLLALKAGAQTHVDFLKRAKEIREPDIPACSPK